MNNSSSDSDTQITTLIFDVDDTLYDVSTGFTASRNGSAAHKFMVEYLNFPDEAAAKVVRDEYFERYHATAKALQVAEREGKFPAADPEKPHQNQSPRFNVQDMAEYWATNLDFALLLGDEKAALVQDLMDCQLNMIAFSNGPRKYVVRVLKELGLWETVFTDESLFAVDDVLPHCKPERKAFETIFDRVGVAATECVMIEDSMKNIRCAKEMGMKTVLITGKRSDATNASEATKPGDAPVGDDPAVDVAIETIEEMRRALPGLWQKPAVFPSWKETC